MTHVSFDKGKRNSHIVILLFLCVNI